MAGWFVLTDTGDPQYFFVLKAINGETILSSGIYKSMSAALQGISIVQACCRLDQCYENRVSARGSLYFVLKNGHGQIIGTSQLYASIFAQDIGRSMVKLSGHTPVIFNMADDFQSPLASLTQPATANV
jgi:uncharacterized protein YegP (UPF0339 family)